MSGLLAADNADQAGKGCQDHPGDLTLQEGALAEDAPQDEQENSSEHRCGKATARSDGEDGGHHHVEDITLMLTKVSLSSAPCPSHTGDDDNHHHHNHHHAPSQHAWPADSSLAASADDDAEGALIVKMRLVNADDLHPPGEVETYTLRALPTATLLELKQELANESGTGITSRDPMVYNGLGQEDMTRSLEGIHFRSGDLIAVVHKPPQHEIPVKTPQGTRHVVTLPETATVRDLKRALSKIPRFEGMVSEATPVSMAPENAEAENDDVEDRQLPDGWLVCLVLFGSRRGRPGGMQIDIRPDIFD